MRAASGTGAAAGAAPVPTYGMRRDPIGVALYLVEGDVYLLLGTFDTPGLAVDFARAHADARKARGVN